MRSVERRKLRLLILVAILKLVTAEKTENVTESPSTVSAMSLVGTAAYVEETTRSGINTDNPCLTGTVENLNTQLVSKYSIQLSWTLPDAVRPCVQYIQIGSSTWTVNISKELTVYTFDDLKQCEPFQLDVRIVSVDGTVGPPKVAEVAEVMSISVTYVSTSEAEIGWNFLSEAVQCLQNVTVVGEQFEQTVKFNETVIISELKVCHSYHFNVTVSFTNGRSYAQSVVVDNRDQLQIEMSIQSDRVGWTYPQEALGCLKSFFIRQMIPLKRMISENSYVLTNESTTGLFSYQLIDPAEVCVARVITIIPQREAGSVSGRRSTKTFAPAEIEQLKFEDVSVETVPGRKVLLSWKKPTLYGECVKEYRVSFLNQSVTVPAQESSVIISGLDACRTYWPILELFDVEGGIRSRVWKNVTVQEEAIGSVQFLELVENDAGIPWLQWEVSNEWAYCVSSYKVEENYYDAAEQKEMRNILEKLVEEPSVTSVQLTAPDVCFLMNVSVTPISRTNVAGPTSSVDLRGLVQQLNVQQSSPDSVTMSWEPPQFVSKCVTHYLIFMNGLSDPVVNTSSNRVLISDLELCKNYTFEVVAVGQNRVRHSPSGVSIFLDDHISAVESVSTTLNTIRWEAPTRGAACVAHYLITQTDPETGRSLFIQTVNVRLLDLAAFDSVEKTTETCEIPMNVDIIPISQSGMEGDSRKLVPTLGPVREIQIDDTVERQIKIQWQPPKHCAEFVKGYRVSYLDKSLLNEADETSIIITELDACVKYNFTITPIDTDDADGKPRSVSATVKEESLSAVVDLSLEEADFGLSVKWNPPENGTYCVAHYRVVAWLPEKEVFWNETSDTHVTLAEVMACATYHVQVIAVSITSKECGHDTAEITTKARVIMKHHIQVVRLVNHTAHSLELQTSLTSENNNMCSLTMALFICRIEGEQPKEFTGSLLIEDPNATYTGVVTSLNPYTEYNCTARIENAAGLSDEPTSIEFRTDEDFPEQPRNLTLIGGSHSIELNWEPPLVKNGIITRYRIHVISSGADYPRPSYCEPLEEFSETFDYYHEEDASKFGGHGEQGLKYTVEHLRPFINYVVQIAAATKAGLGPYTEMLSGRTFPAQPDPVYEFAEYNVTLSVVDEPYNSSVFISWFLPCYLNGHLRSFMGQFIGFRAGLEHALDWSLTIADGEVISDKYTFVEHRLEPEFQYNVSILVFVNDVANHSHPKFLSFESPAGIPVIKDDINWGTVDVMEAPNPTQTAKISLSQDIFDSQVGSIRHVALLLSERRCQADPIPSRNLSTGWPDLLSWSQVFGMHCTAQYQTTPQEWSPVQVVSTNQQTREQAPVVYVIGNETCEDRQGYCNGPLKPGTEYALVVRVFTQSGFSDSALQFFQTDSLIQLTLIVATIFVCLLVAFMLGIIVLWHHHKLVADTQVAVRSPNDEPADIPLKSFSGIYEELIQSNREKIMKEYQSINYFSEQLLNDRFFVGKENERKNRYLGIMPYDGNRVPLDFDDIVGDEDEEVNDYINASFIDGYKYQREYIATQGPKKETTFDFWRMILQYEVESIVMLTQLVENDKIKCYQYFPRYNQQASFRDVTIKCTQELNLTFYKKRLLMVTRGNIRRAVFHYHFLVWPDHGCPASPTDLIRFIKAVRSERKNLALPVVVHCSAGVGRTGTLIALDIIIQRIQQEKKINIYDTVKQLRRQRVKMVQTSDQYAFLYQSCLEYTTRNGRKKPKTSSDEISTESSLSSSVPNGSFRKPRIKIKFPKYFQSGISNVKTYAPDDIENRS
ncbi:phosphatidylinositol phosphatase PTPRQ [Wyeomyia smithii]|uniref:phosphatidylinositol phosphatase PTPRQ n=1 Tax=Wyeomyia smithii TaxID=174621 RepID=UPI002467B3E7|nr:phosphatidylinositol phosphatase PTPRQ [Wyeomyia smithii]XP_055532784.1 phosphatidylinositol phosphatase PTPRQ [Wyeomyia smithii]XP_055532785.1 phosphatidylinositol phosphatase PTPRQ [Wyeomyia smithii]XP_055532786.1 phosphatidylinositol phosphatase PTPRQ [Wyeomyia smithii]XP_055532787.1 phosphatidylinositol phosphatase PTPRQ [Wyeomyia smithii]